MEYSVAMINGVWVVACWSNDYQCWTMVCKTRKQAEKVAQAYSKGKELHIVVEEMGDVLYVVGTCSRKRDTRRIIDSLFASARYRGLSVTSFCTLSLSA